MEALQGNPTRRPDMRPREPGAPWPQPITDDDWKAIEGTVDKDDPAAVKEIRALELRLKGHSYASIAAHLGYAQAAPAMIAVKRAMRKWLQEPLEEMLQVELARLDRDYLALETKAREGDPQAIAVRLKIMERRAKLVGLDKPIQIDIRAQLIEEAIKMGIDEADAIRAAEEIIKNGIVNPNPAPG